MIGGKNLVLAIDPGLEGALILTDGEVYARYYHMPVEEIGKERNIEGKDHIRGLVKDSIDPQRLVNYWNTAAAETVAA